MTKNILVLWGDDFAHQRADRTFLWLDSIIADLEEAIGGHNQSNTPYKFMRSTMAEFFDSVSAEAKENQIEFSEFNGDFWKYN